MIDNIIRKIKHKSERGNYIPDGLRNRFDSLSGTEITIYDKIDNTRLTITQEKVLIYINNDGFFEQLHESENGPSNDEMFNLRLLNISELCSAENIERIRGTFNAINVGFYIIYEL